MDEYADGVSPESEAIFDTIQKQFDLGRNQPQCSGH